MFIYDIELKAKSAFTVSRDRNAFTSVEKHGGRHVYQ